MITSLAAIDPDQNAALSVQEVMIMPHPVILSVALLLVLGYVVRRVLPARVVVQHLEVRVCLAPTFKQTWLSQICHCAQLCSCKG